MKKRARLVDLEVREISGVGKREAANPHARVVLLKRHTGAEEGKMPKTAYERLMKKAAKYQKKHPGVSEAVAFTKVLADPRFMDLVVAERAERVVKLGGGTLSTGNTNNVDINGRREAWPIPVIPLRPRPITDATGDVVPLDGLVDAYLKSNPTLSRAQAYAAILKTPLGTAAYRRERDQRLMASPVIAGAARRVA
jgi:hypothetical protein